MNVKFIFSLTILSANLQAQTFMVSNLDQTPSSFSSAQSTFWHASSFTTGSETATLQSMMTRLREFDGGDKFISIYNNSSTNSPGSRIVSFSNYDDLGTNNQFRLTPESAFEFEADTTYWMVFGATAGGVFEFIRTSSTTETSNAGWSIGDSRYRSSDQGTSWSFFTSGAAQFQINAIIPESETYLLASGLMIGIFILVRRRIAKRIAKSV